MVRGDLTVVLLAGLLVRAASGAELVQLDPFAQATAGFPACPAVQPRLLTLEESRTAAHARVERGTRCALEGTCEPGGAYKRDAEINEQVRLGDRCRPSLRRQFGVGDDVAEMGDPRRLRSQLCAALGAGPIRCATAERGARLRPVACRRAAGAALKATRSGVRRRGRAGTTRRHRSRSGDRGRSTRFRPPAHRR